MPGIRRIRRRGYLVGTGGVGWASAHRFDRTSGPVRPKPTLRNRNSIPTEYLATLQRKTHPMLLLILAYLGGVLTILSPCILPVLPFVFARADQPFARSATMA